MSNHTFTNWLHKEVTSARCALLTLYEQIDKLQYMEGPLLEQEYMEKVGTFEETVIKEEIECELLQKKQSMIQSALNRREPVDQAVVDAEIDKERQKLLREAAGSSVPKEYADLTTEQNDELQELYRNIIKNFHPQMHPELSQAHKELFKKAQDAYRHKDLNALKLIHDMMVNSPDEDFPIDLLFELLTGTKHEQPTEIKKETDSRRDFGTDYDLVALIYGAFAPTAEEIVIQEERARYQKLMSDVMKDIEALRIQFPYNTADLLSNPKKVEAYREDLNRRLLNAKEECERRKNEINHLLERVVCNE